MIFAATWQNVVNGTKTQTRRIVHDGEPCRYVVGRTYAVQKERCGKAICRILVVDVRQEMLDDITDFDASLEGFDNREAFIAGWKSLHGGYIPTRKVHVITFCKVRNP